MKDVIQKFHLESDKNELENELRVFSMQLKHSKLTFSALEFFQLDWELMVEVRACYVCYYYVMRLFLFLFQINNDITSYFIFFIQYQINMDAKDRKVMEAHKKS